MKVDKKLVRLAEDLVSYAKNKGADQVQISINEGSNFSVDVLQGKIEKLTEAGSKNVAIKVIKDQKVATGSSSDLDQDTLYGLIDRSLQRAVLLNPDPFSALPEKQSATVNAESLNIYDASIQKLRPENKIKMAKKIEQICLKDKRVKKSYGASVSSFGGVRYLANSNGFSGAYRRTSINCGINLQSGSGDNLFDEGKSDYARRLDMLMKPEDVAREAVHRVTRLIDAEKIQTETMPIVFEPGTAGMLLGFLNGCVNGGNIFRKSSFLTDKLGEKIAAEHITVIDDGLIPGAPGSKPFDNEGVATQKTVVVENGILKSYLLDTYSARKLKMKSTGNGSGANNLYIQPGKHTPQEIIASVKRGLLLTGVMAFGLDNSTGSISKGAFGMLIENGKITKPVAEITISGNLADVLQNITMVGNDLKHSGNVVSPTLLVSEMTIGGK
ncbi:TldD/PmbA family protein [bacterium]|nr:TldD/PmbA family protein [bacterium]